MAVRKESVDFTCWENNETNLRIVERPHCLSQQLIHLSAEEGRKGMKNFILPQELTVEILLRLPVKSLLRFKSVCKLWLYIISDSRFAKSHFDLAAIPAHRLITTYKFGSKIMSLALEASWTNDFDIVWLKFPPLPPPPLSTCPRHIYKLPCLGFTCCKIVGNCRGIMLLATSNDDVLVWNPSTGIHRQLPISYNKLDPMNLPNINYNILYDKSRDDYLLVLIGYYAYGSAMVESSHSQFQIFSLKSNVSSFMYCLNFEYKASGTAGLFLNQSLHWLVISKATQLPLVVAFDLTDRTFAEIPLSSACVELYRSQSYKFRYYLTILGGCLCLCYIGGNDVLAGEIWVMKEYKVSSSWTKSFVLPPNISYRNNEQLSPICFTKGGALLASSGGETIVKLNENGEVLEHHSYELKSIFPKQNHMMYRESLLALP